ncbi:hypothetical protein CWE15_05985 [Aliidiomarina taiwanensis]|uniref:histidine kinase n=1 Tax=Aliidiomarina taiwanensis TaxID=946228 RepID=A0A432X7V4_9GAMM|nr:HAMP domain-containing sensor histidine kinase [Aliidiomarina taiwanensis]RUO42949.1 hypothetical protein CWE15_05985 [Aliidiomarina taiwanensis]
MARVFVNSLQQRLLLIAVLAVTVTLCAAFFVTISTQLQVQKKDLVSRTEAILHVLATSLKAPLEKGQTEQVNAVLSGLREAQFIRHVHVYRAALYEQQPLYFASYNRPNTAPLPMRTTQLEELISPRATADYVELAKPIYNDDRHLVGHVYIRTSATNIYQEMWRAIAIAIASLLAAMVLVTLLLKLMYHRATHHIYRMSQRLRNINQQQNYSLRLVPSGYTELNQVSISVNGILDKLQRVMQYNEECEQQHKKLTQELEQDIQQRTTALRKANTQLIDTLEQLHASQQRRIETERLASMTDIVSGIAHEVNTPLGLSVTAASMLEDSFVHFASHYQESLSPEVDSQLNDMREHLDIVLRNLARADELIARFRSLAFEHAKEPSETLNLKKLALAAGEQVRPLIQHRQTQGIVVDAPDQYISMRRRPLETILKELLENAALHGFKGQKKGIIKLNVSCNSETLHISCSDNGVGMTEAMQRRVFEPFTTSKRIDGHPGLGMHLVYNLVRYILKGTIHYESQLDKGTTISIEIPLSD